MRRREFFAGIGLATTFPRFARAQYVGAQCTRTIARPIDCCQTRPTGNQNR